MPKLVHSDFDITSLEFLHPTKNKNYNGMGAKVKGDILIQFGESETPCCVVHENIENNALKIGLSGDVVAWFEDLDNHIVRYVQKNTTSWFGKELSMEDISRMSAPLMTNDNEIIIKIANNTRCYLDNGTDIYNRVEINAIEEDHIIVPVVQMNGLYIASRHFTPSFTVKDILIVGRQEKNTDSVPFSLRDQEEEQDIVDPFSYYTKDGGSSQGSFETHVFGAR